MKSLVKITIKIQELKELKEKVWSNKVIGNKCDAQIEILEWVLG